MSAGEAASEVALIGKAHAVCAYHRPGPEQAEKALMRSAAGFENCRNAQLIEDAVGQEACVCAAGGEMG